MSSSGDDDEEEVYLYSRLIKVLIKFNTRPDSFLRKKRHFQDAEKIVGGESVLEICVFTEVL